MFVLLLIGLLFDNGLFALLFDMLYFLSNAGHYVQKIWRDWLK